MKAARQPAPVGAPEGAMHNPQPAPNQHANHPSEIKPHRHSTESRNPVRDLKARTLDPGFRRDDEQERQRKSAPLQRRFTAPINSARFPAVVGAPEGAMLSPRRPTNQHANHYSEGKNCRHSGESRNPVRDLMARAMDPGLCRDDEQERPRGSAALQQSLATILTALRHPNHHHASTTHGAHA
jgi:hypothetical protein